MRLIDARLKPDDQEAITPGKAVTGMLLNGLGFAHRLLPLTPPLFASKPLDPLFRPGIDASMFNRFQRPDLKQAVLELMMSLKDRTAALHGPALVGGLL